MSIGTIVADITGGSFTYEGHTYLKSDVLQERIVGQRLALILKWWAYMEAEGIDRDLNIYTEQEQLDFFEAFENPAP